MKRLIAVALLLGASSAWGREPLLIPPAADGERIRQGELTQPTERELAAVGAPPPAPGLVPQPDGDYAPQPVPVPQGQPLPGPGFPGEIHPGPAGPLSGQFEPGIICDACDAAGIPLFTDVRVRRPRNIPLCAVPKIVAVPDPNCPCSCVFIEICVPAGACEQVIYKHCGNRVRFDYGKYAVDVISRRGKVIVKYRS